MRDWAVRLLRIVVVCLGAGIIVRGLACAADVVRPPRNAWGNPAMEEQRQMCRVPGTRSVVRLYRGNGGATVDFWYTITEARAGRRELQFWYSYSSPAVDSIACVPGAVRVYAVDTTGHPLTRAFSVVAIDSDLVRRPLAFQRDSMWRAEPAGRWSGGNAFGSALRLLAALVLIGVGGTLITLAIRPGG